MTDPHTERNAPRRVLLVPHTHWDREWYFTTAQSKVLLLESMTVILDELEAGRLPCFVLDGQTSLLEDYLSNAPDEAGRIAALVRAGTLKIGPWYTQTDQCVVGAESILRNLLYGIRDSRRFGGHMAIGYVPDSFGQTAQLPQILTQFGLRRCVFWRGWWEGISEATEFTWVAVDGSEVTTAVIPTGYSGVKGMPGAAGLRDYRFAHIRRHLETLEQRNTTATTLLMAGNDQQPWDRRLPDLLAAENTAQDRYHYELACIEQFFETVEQEADLDRVTGEMLMGKYSRIHRGIYSTRYDIKKANADAENLITHVLEPVLSIGWSLGFAWPHGLLENAWKLLLKSHAHDSIGGCNSDPVNRAVKQRLTDARTMCEQQLQLRMRQIAERVQPEQDGGVLLLFNPLPERRREPVLVELVAETRDPAALTLTDGQGDSRPFQPIECEAVRLSELVQDLAEALKPGQSGDPLLHRHRLLVDAGELPALGYTTLYVSGGKGGAMTVNGAESGNRIENDRLAVWLADDGTVTIRNRADGSEWTGLLEFVDGGDAGDNYDFSPPGEDWLVSTRGASPAVEARRGPLESTLTLHWVLRLPRTLEARAGKTADADLPLTATLRLVSGSDLVEVRVEVDNSVSDHRLQAVFRTGLDAGVSHADEPFGVVTRPCDPPELDEWPGEWTSKPLPLYPMQSWVALSDGQRGLGVITDGIREYQCFPDAPGDLAVTLFRAVGFMGKPDLLYRPGRLSGMPLPTPDSQLQGPLRFRFALQPFAGDPSAMAGAARRFLSGVRTYQVSGYEKFSLNRGTPDLPAHYSLFELRSPLVVSAVKKAEDRDALVLRAFNPSARRVAAGALEFAAGSPLGAAQVRISDFAETPGRLLQGGLGGVQAAPQQALTWLIGEDTDTTGSTS